MANHLARSKVKREGSIRADREPVAAGSARDVADADRSARADQDDRD